MRSVPAQLLVLAWMACSCLLLLPHPAQAQFAQAVLRHRAMQKLKATPIIVRARTEQAAPPAAEGNTTLLRRQQREQRLERQLPQQQQPDEEQQPGQEQQPARQLDQRPPEEQPQQQPGRDAQLPEVVARPALPACPGSRLLETEGVPTDWPELSLRRQAAHPVNALMLQLSYAVWEDDPQASLGDCLVNMGIDRESIYIVHKVVLPFLGTMTALVVRSDKGVFVSFRGTDFGDAGDIAVDSFCQHTPPAIARLFGAAGDLRLHTGFYRAWDTVSERVLDAVAKQLKHTSTNKVYVIGHSLGAAMATIAALRMDTLFADTAYEVGGVWLFGCPRVGNDVWAATYNDRLLERTLRFVQFADFAVRLPMQLQICPSRRIGATFAFAHVGQQVLLCPDARTGLVRWRLSANGSEVLDCGRTPDTPDISVTTHWLGSYFDAWRRGATAASAPRGGAPATNLAVDPYVASVMCAQCSLSYPQDAAKQLNVIARAGGPVACSTSASCNQREAWQAAAGIGDGESAPFNPASSCQNYVCS